MFTKHPVYPERVRRIPTQFSWVDHRLVRDGYIERCSHASAALYLFLVTVSDAAGLSYYSDPSLMKRLRMDAMALEECRNQLIRCGLIAHKKPIYQVLPLNENTAATSVPTPPSKQEERSQRKQGKPQALKEIFKQIMEEGS